MERPRHPFDQADSAWQRYVYHLARWQLLQLRDIAGACNVKLNTFKSYPDILAVAREGWSDARGSVNHELMAIAAADPYAVEDPSERAQVRSLKMDALKTLHRTFEKRDELGQMAEERDKDRETLKNLSTEELKQRAKALLS